MCTNDFDIICKDKNIFKIYFYVYLKAKGQQLQSDKKIMPG